MLTQSEIKFLRSLSVKKYRKQHGQFLIEGYRLICECLKSGYPVETIWMSDAFSQSDNGEIISEDLQDRGLDWMVVEANAIRKVTDTQNDQGIIALLPMSMYTGEPVCDDQVLVLENISDPGNLGTLLRSAEWFGLQSVVMSENSVDPFSPKVVRAAMGAHFNLSIYIKSLTEFLPLCKEHEYSIIGGVMDGDVPDRLSEIRHLKWILLLGNEAHGLSPAAKAELTHHITIPKLGQGESLNLSVAGGILMNELTKMK